MLCSPVGVLFGMLSSMIVLDSARKPHVLQNYSIGIRLIFSNCFLQLIAFYLTSSTINSFHDTSVGIGLSRMYNEANVCDSGIDRNRDLNPV